MDITTTLNMDLALVAENAYRSLVHVVDGASGSGSGIVWANGTVLTNAHVVRSAPTLVLPDGRRLGARVVGYDRSLDLAALYSPGLRRMPIERGNSRRLRPGEFVCAIGAPLGIMGSVTAGSVLEIGNTWNEPALRGRDWIITDVRLQPGNSGSLLVDARGKLIGINSMVIAPALGIAIPVHVAEVFMNSVLV